MEVFPSALFLSMIFTQKLFHCFSKILAHILFDRWTFKQFLWKSIEIHKPVDLVSKLPLESFKQMELKKLPLKVPILRGFSTI